MNSKILMSKILVIWALTFVIVTESSPGRRAPKIERVQKAELD